MLLDPQQIFVEKKLNQLAQDLESQALTSFFKKIISPKTQLKSFYIHGDVGRGKSMLMKGFFESLAKTPKVYFHFNSFMRAIHEALRDIRKEDKKFKDELIEAVKRVAKENRLICFDEFQVLDIADAMLLSRIFSYLFSQGVVVIFTSNSEPLALYKNGLQREVFLEFVKNILLKNCEVLFLDSPTDYRSKYVKNLTKRYFISNKENREEVKQIIEKMTDGAKLKPAKLKVWGREIKIAKTYKKIAVFNFDDLCRVEFAAADYQAICQNFDLIFLLKIPQLLPEDANEARRLVLFIDEAYEKKTALIILAKTKSEKIYENGSGAEAFKRTVSRLNEIQSDQYWSGFEEKSF
ncbi:MAG: cell division protein ZapE [Rickettsiales bacterium]|nr:cell division protein ZapE [Rickettsiales bacterium]